MSIEIDWAKLTTGEDGLALAESIREFIHEKFQQVTLPGFIRAVEVHSFEFGPQCPTVVLKDVCDPLPDFYEDSDEDDSQERQPGEDQDDDYGDGETPHASQTLPPAPSRAAANKPLPPPVATHVLPQNPTPGGARGLASQLTSPLMSRSSTPGIPGGTSNLSYFHLPPLSARLPAAGGGPPHMPGLAAMASSRPSYDQSNYHAPPWEYYPRPPPLPPPPLPSSQQQQQPPSHVQSPTEEFSYGDPSTRPSTAHSFARSQADADSDGIFVDLGAKMSPGLFPPHREPDPNDLQVVLHISYAGDVRMSLTAELLLDYPMPSFVGIPLKLNITGLSFDGVALLAYLRRRAHFCFLGPDDADMLVGAESMLDDDDDDDDDDGDGAKEEGRKEEEVAAAAKGGNKGERGGKGEPGKGKLEPERKEGLGGLLREIRVESEIGQKEGGKQVLKNVGKVEKFVLEQVRRIFEEEMVWPSFWTFLV